MNRASQSLAWGMLPLVVLAWPTLAPAQSVVEWGKARTVMVDVDIAGNGVKDQRVLAAMRSTPRHEFVPSGQRKLAYFDMSLPIGEQQTISAPFAVAKMTEQLEPKPTDIVLEVGTGSGYQAAVLAGLVKEVYTIEIIEPLGTKAAERLKRLGYRNVFPRIGDGYQGWKEHAPFDKIIVTCSPERIPKPLVDQLREGGRMIIPVGERYQQTLTLLKKVNGKLVTETLEPTYFVPMTGRAEDMRQNPDPATPALVNGNFETAIAGSDQPQGWYYMRQGRLESEPQRGRVLRFTNATPGRASQAIQAVGVDHSKQRYLDVDVWAKASHIRRGVTPEQLPKVLVSYFDENRSPVGQEQVGPWKESFDWTRQTGRLKIPKKARLAIIAVGLLGGTGDLMVDDISVRAVP